MGLDGVLPMSTDSKRAITATQREDLLTTLKTRFDQNSSRHQGINWGEVEAKLLAQPEKLWPLSEMERTGGELRV